MSEKVLMKGNEAVAESAIRAGCRHFFGYPITPQTEVAAYFAKRMPKIGGTYLISAMMFLFAEVFMHLILFPVALKTFYNAGIITAVCGLGFIGCYYFTRVFDASMYVWYDYVLAVVWFVAVFMFCFRSKLYWNLGKKPGYDLTEITAYGAGFKR